MIFDVRAKDAVATTAEELASFVVGWGMVGSCYA
jgi:hypothetical protein